MSGRASGVIVVFAALFVVSEAQGATIDAAYQQGLKAYYEGRYDEAIALFERIAAAPMRHEDLFYNLGCAYFRVGKLGHAIYNFERSLVLDETKEDAKFNLRTARAQVGATVTDVLKGVPNEAWWAKLVKPLSLKSWSLLFLAFWWLSFVLLIALRWVAPGPGRAGLIASNALVGLLTLVCAAFLAGRLYLAKAQVTGIILPDRVQVRQGPSAAAKSTFKLHAGLKVTLLHQQAEWSRIRLANGLEGWVKRSALGVM